MTKTYILGGGIAGLIWAFYNDGIVISPEIGGQMNSQIQMGPRYLHDTPDSRKFLQDVGMPIIPRKITTGYLINVGEDIEDLVIVDKIPSEKFKQQYYMKSRGRKDLQGYDETSMSSGKNSFDALDVDFNELIAKLEDKLEDEDRVIKGKVEMIVPASKKIIIVNGGNRTRELEYDKLISTIPLWLVNNMLHLGLDLKSETVTFVVLKSNNYFLLDFDYIYVPQEDVAHHRLTKCADKKFIVAEIFGAKTKEELVALYGENYETHMHDRSQIIPIKETPKVDGIIFVGRFGTWNRKWKTETVISEAMNHAKVQHG